MHSLILNNYWKIKISYLGSVSEICKLTFNFPICVYVYAYTHTYTLYGNSHVTAKYARRRRREGRWERWEKLSARTPIFYMAGTATSMLLLRRNVQVPRKERERERERGDRAARTHTVRFDSPSPPPSSAPRERTLDLHVRNYKDPKYLSRRLE